MRKKKKKQDEELLVYVLRTELKILESHWPKLPGGAEGRTGVSREKYPCQQK